jgi:hypothetical protein
MGACSRAGVLQKIEHKLLGCLLVLNPVPPNPVRLHSAASFAAGMTAMNTCRA